MNYNRAMISASARVSQASATLMAEIENMGPQQKSCQRSRKKEKSVNSNLQDIATTDFDDEIPTVWSSKYFGLAAAYFITGIFYAFNSLIFPLATRPTSVF